ncbi:MAG: hypothetical protein J6K72_07045 [Clostridia bacterium]|nr:hypothetical protein [Clostridia bacterium]
MIRWMIFGGACLALLFSGECMAAAVDTAAVFAKSVLPALFPMMVLSSLLGALPGGRGPRWMIFLETVCFCFLSGSPASAKRVTELRQKDERFSCLTAEMMGFCGVVSPLFFLGTLQSRLPQGSGLMLLLCHWMAALLTGLLLWRMDRQRRIARTVRETSPEEPVSLLTVLPRAIGQSMQSLLMVLGAMMLFGILAALSRSLVSRLLPPAWQKPELFAVLWAVMEIGGGGLAVADAFPAPLPLLCGLCSFGGLSIWMQCLLFIGKEIRPGKLLLIRLLHGAMGYLLCLLFTGLRAL